MYSYSNLILFVVGIFLLPSCSKSALSDRDQQQNQRRNTAELKREELRQVVGRYSGILTQSSGKTSNVSLTLLIKELPVTTDGQIDPVTVPTLGGYLRFNFGVDAEYLPFDISKADFDPRRGSVSLETKNGQYGDLKANLVKDGDSLSGDWSVTNLDSGFLQIAKSNVTEGFLAIPQVRLAGTYLGKLAYVEGHDGPIYGAALNFVPTQDLTQPSGVKLTGAIRLFYGEFDSLEYDDYRLDYLTYNHFTRRVVAKVSEDPKITIDGIVEGNRITAQFISDVYGNMGRVQLIQEEPQMFLAQFSKGTR